MTEVDNVLPPNTELEEGEWLQFHAGGHFIQVWVEDGVPHINIRDHAQIAVEGDHKDTPTVVVGENEFPTIFDCISERAFWERYNGESPERSDTGTER